MKYYHKIRSEILQRLETNLAPELYYHSIHHTIDVEQQAIRIARSEGISDDDDDLCLLKIASLFHDTGFLFTYDKHEEMGFDIARQTLPGFGITSGQLNVIQGLIMATSIPQLPKTKLEEIICDADLDYLGRDDFFPVSTKLFEEMKAMKKLETMLDWNKIQAGFFHQHTYFTATSKKLRAHKKHEHLLIIEEEILKETQGRETENI